MRKKRCGGNYTKTEKKFRSKVGFLADFLRAKSGREDLRTYHGQDGLSLVAVFEYYCHGPGAFHIAGMGLS
jgi:hypothetical protein